MSNNPYDSITAHLTLLDDQSYDDFIKKDIPNLCLNASNGSKLNLKEILNKSSVVFLYPKTGEPDGHGGWIDPAPGWGNIPGAVGCTKQSLSYKELYTEFLGLGYEIYGISTQTSFSQKEFVARNNIPFLLLSDEEQVLLRYFCIPHFKVEGNIFYKRATWIVNNGIITDILYPIYNTAQSAIEALNLIKNKYAVIDNE